MDSALRIDFLRKLRNNYSDKTEHLQLYGAWIDIISVQLYNKITLRTAKII